MLTEDPKKEIMLKSQLNAEAGLYRSEERLRVGSLFLRVERSQLSQFRWLLDVSLGRCFRHAHPGGDPSRFGNILVSP